MAFRAMLAKTLLPNLERDLGRSVAAEMATARTMVDNMLSPSVFAYTAGKTGGAFKSSARRYAPVQKVHYEPPTRTGLFAEEESWNL